jgi:DNA polymerase I
MRIVVDVEGNGYTPTKIWVIVCKDIDSGNYEIFREVTQDPKESKRFLEFATKVNHWIGHNLLGFDLPVLNRLTGLSYEPDNCTDTFIISKLVDYSRSNGHSLEAYGKELGCEKGEHSDFTQYSEAMERYCIRDCDICQLVYDKYLRIIRDVSFSEAIRLEHSFQCVVNDLHGNGFGFNSVRANKLLHKVCEELSVLDKDITDQFPPKLKLVKEITPRITKYGTINKSDFRWVKGGDLSDYNGGPFCRCSWSNFNPASPKQIIDVLASAGWMPIAKTKTHLETERSLNKLKYLPTKDKSIDLEIELCNNRLLKLRKYGWKINEENLSSLPPSAPQAALTLAKRILIESRRRTLTEWLGLVSPDGRIHGQFMGIGAWTHRMAHQKPNTANIPRDDKLYGHEMRSLWQAPRNRLLVGVDAKGIQLRVFAHYIDDPEFTHEVIHGDPHALNQSILAPVCRSRAAAKTFIYALLLGAGLGKIQQILQCSTEEADRAYSAFIARYKGYDYLKGTIIPIDARRGWFRGLDGRIVPIPGDTAGQRRHLCMSGYLQNGEAIIMKRACLKWYAQLKDISWKLVNFVHDEWQTECANNMDIALQIAKVQANSLREVGQELKLRCPMEGTFMNDDDYTIGPNWSFTH